VNELDPLQMSDDRHPHGRGFSLPGANRAAQRSTSDRTVSFRSSIANGFGR